MLSYKSIGQLKLINSSKVSGSFSTFVCKADITRENKEERVAVKRFDISDISLTSNDVAIRFQIKHQNVTRILHQEITDENMYLALEDALYSLHQCVSEKTFPMERLHILRQATTGLQYLHHMKIPHTNLKPTNILVYKSGDTYIAKLSDFWFEATRTRQFRSTDTRQECWLAREQFVSADTNHFESIHVDIFSMGCIYYHTLTEGLHPFGLASETKENIKNNISNLIIKKFCGRDKLALIQKMISLVPVDRPSCDQILNDNIFWQESNPQIEDGIFYLNENKIDDGSDGTVVYKGYHAKNCRKIDCAVKVIRKKQIRDSVLAEIDFLVACGDHPNIVRYYGYLDYEHMNETRIALELCNFNLVKWVGMGRFQKPGIRPREILIQITKGVYHLHSKNIVHRDLKPNNIFFKLINENEIVVKIADFGISRMLESSNKMLTSPGQCLGWRSPEEIRAANNSSGNKEKLTPEMDIFKLGLLFCYVFTNGHHPFGSTPEVQDSNIANGNYTIIEGSSNLAIRCNKHIILEMLASEQTERPAALAILDDPILWDSEKQYNFFKEICTLVDGIKFDGKYKKNTDDWKKQICLHQLDTDYYATISNNYDANGWFSNFQGSEEFEKKIFKYLNSNRYTNDNYNSVIGLIKVIRDFKIHFKKPTDNELLVYVRQEIGLETESYMNFWLERFPLLIYHTRNVFQKFKHDPNLCVYYRNFKAVF